MSLLLDNTAHIKTNGFYHRSTGRDKKNSSHALPSIFQAVVLWKFD
jgi:hypothetical protein